MRCDEAQELITALVDNELSHDERLSIEGHLKDCDRCRIIRAQESALKQQVQAASAMITAPEELRDRVLSGLRGNRRIEGAMVTPQTSSWWTLPGFRPALALALLAILVLPVLYFRSPARNIALAALETHERVVAGKMDLIQSADPYEIQQQMIRAVGGRFAPMGYDLSMINVRPVGGAVQKVRERKILVTVYKGEGPAVTCFTFLGSEEDAPKNSQIFFDPEKKVSFYSFSREGVQGVFHREGNVICILVSRMPMGDLLAIARAKAKPV